MTSATTQFTFFQDFPKGNDISFPLSLLDESSDRAWHPVSGPRACGLNISWCLASDSVPEGGTDCKPALLSYSRPSDHRSKGHWLELSAFFFFFSEQTIHMQRVMKPTSSPPQRGECSRPRSRWKGNLSIWAFMVFLCISCRLIRGLCRAWVGEDGRVGLRWRTL